MPVLLSDIEMEEHPRSIVLNRTLKSLYALDDAADQDDLVLIYFMSQMQPKKYIYQAPSINIGDPDMVIRCITQVLPQYYAMFSGPMPAIFLDVGLSKAAVRDSSELQTITCLNDAERTFSQLAPSQRPQVTFVRRLEEINLKSGFKMSPWKPMDILAHLPSAVDFDIQYKGLNKRTLALCGLPTPKTDVIETLLNPVTVRDDVLRAAEVERMVVPVKERTLPFVAKLPQAHSSMGTWLIRSEVDRAEAIRVLEPEVNKMLLDLNLTNEHLFPSCLVVQEMIPGETMAVSVFVTKSGHLEFVAACDQYMEMSGRWGGAHIAYAEQDGLKKKYSALLEKLAVFVKELGYHGPLGVDIITNLDGDQFILDLNLRPTGSYALGFLDETFWKQRGLAEATVLLPIILMCSYDEFYSRFGAEIEAGRLIIAGWSHGSSGKCSAAAVICAGETSDDLGKLVLEVQSCQPCG